MIRRRMAEAALHDHAVAFAQPVVARRAVNVEAVAPALQRVRGYGEGKLIHRFAVGPFAGIERHVVVQLPARHRALRQRPCAAPVAEEIRRPQRDEFRLIVHVLTAGGQREQRGRYNYPNLRAARRCYVGQAGSLRPIVNRPGERSSPARGNQPARRPRLALAGDQPAWATACKRAEADCQSAAGCQPAPHSPAPIPQLQIPPWAPEYAGSRPFPPRRTTGRRPRCTGRIDCGWRGRTAAR